MKYIRNELIKVIYNKKYWIIYAAFILLVSAFFCFLMSIGFQGETIKFNNYMRVYYTFYHVVNLFIGYIIILYVEFDSEIIKPHITAFPIDVGLLHSTKILISFILVFLGLSLNLFCYTLFCVIFNNLVLIDYDKIILFIQIFIRLAILSVPFWLLIFYCAVYIGKKLILYLVPFLLLIFSFFTVFNKLPFGIFSQEVVRLVTGNPRVVVQSNASIYLSMVSSLTILIVVYVWNRKRF